MAGLLDRVLPSNNRMPHPETRSMENYALSAAGVLPLIPPVTGATRALRPSQVDMRICQMAVDQGVPK